MISGKLQSRRRDNCKKSKDSSIKKILVALILTILLSQKKRPPKIRGLLRLKRSNQRQRKSPKKSQKTFLIEHDY